MPMRRYDEDKDEVFFLVMAALVLAAVVMVLFYSCGG